jgi:hypothetical protein
MYALASDEDDEIPLVLLRSELLRFIARCVLWVMVNDEDRPEWRLQPRFGI